MSEQNLQPKPNKPFYKKWWFWLIAVIVVVAIANSGKKGNSSNDSDYTDESNNRVETSSNSSDKLPTVGEKLQTSYFEITLNKAYIDNKIDTGNQFLDKEAEQGNKFLILDITFKNIDDESRMFMDGSVYIKYNGKEYEYDKSETIMAEGWGTLLDQLNPLTTKSTKLVYKIPSEISGPVYWEPGRNSDDKKFFCGNL